MKDESYTRTIEVAASPSEIFRALTKEIDKWWTTAADDASRVGTTATFRFDESYHTMLIEEIVPDHLVVWKCVAQRDVFGGLTVHDGWVGTTLNWKIEARPEASRIVFVHQGLVPRLECYELCRDGWDHFTVSLKNYLETGVGQPHQQEEGRAVARKR